MLACAGDHVHAPVDVVPTALARPFALAAALCEEAALGARDLFQALSPGQPARAVAATKLVAPDAFLAAARPIDGPSELEQLRCAGLTSF